MPFEIDRPEHLADDYWIAIHAHLQRLNAATDAKDRPSMVGAAKDLTEAAAKVIVTARGGMVDAKADFTACLTQAHKTIDRQPGVGVAAEPLIRDIARGYKTAASTLAQLRNAYGTGHGRAIEPVVHEEIALAAVEASVLWCRWALRRLGPYLVGTPALILKDLQSGIFTRGDLTERLAAASLKDLEPGVQRAIGNAVTHRAGRNTFNVFIEGVQQAAASDDYELWPLAYREGLVEGAFVDVQGEFHVWAAQEEFARLLTDHPEAERILTGLAAKAGELPWSTRMRSREYAAQVAEGMALQAPLFRRYGLEELWSSIRDQVAGLLA